VVFWSATVPGAHAGDGQWLYVPPVGRTDCVGLTKWFQMTNCTGSWESWLLYKLEGFAVKE